jgi:hypothetical protein
MGLDAPKVFTHADKRIRMRGLLPPISIEASESEVRREIDVIRTCSFPDLTECTPYDFEFIDMCGKQATIPRCKVGFEWKGRAVKELAGSGCLYVRLTRDVGLEYAAATSDEEDEFPVVCLGSQPASSDASATNSQLPCSSRSLAPSSFTSSASSSSRGQSQFQDVEVESGGNGPSTSNEGHQEVEKEGSAHGDMAKMVEMFPHLSEGQLKHLVDISDHSIS